MKLFKSLLVTSAFLGLLAPITATASEINIDEMNSYVRKKSSSKKQLNSQSFSKDLAKINESVERIDSGINEFEAGSFSSTTTMDGSASFVIGAIDNFDQDYPNTSEALNAHYSYNIDLNTSFNGEDNLHLGLEAGNANGLILLESTNVNATSDTLNLNSLFYSRQAGKWDLAIGPKLAQDDLVATTTTKYSDSFTFNGGGFGNNVWTLPGLSGPGIAVQRVFDNGFNIGGNVISTLGSTSKGILTKEGFDVKTLMIGYDGDNFGGGIIHTKYDDIWDIGENIAQDWLTYFNVSKLSFNTWDIGAYWLASDKLTTNIGVSFIDANIGKSADTFTDITLSMDYDLNDKNTISAAYGNINFLNTNGTADLLGDTFEFYYTHSVNDSMSLKGGIYVASPSLDNGNGTPIKNGGTGDDFLLLNETIYALETTFKF